MVSIRNRAFSGLVRGGVAGVLLGQAGLCTGQTCTPSLNFAQHGPALPPVQFLAAGDFNGDGRADLVSQPILSDIVEVRFALPGGGFAPPVSTVIGSLGLGRVVVRDFNGDGVPDLFSETFATPSVRGVWFGSPSGSFTFGFGVPLSVGATTVGDLNGDGQVDFVGFVAAAGGGATGELRALINRGGGVFTSHLLANLPAQAAPIIGDLNGDARPDILLVSGGSPITVQALLQGPPGQAGDPGAVAVQPASTLPSAPAGNTPVLIDVNGDGAADLVYPGSTGYLVAYFRVASTGTAPAFGAPVVIDPFVRQLTVAALNRLTFADVNGDGVPDFVRQLAFAGDARTTVSVKFGVRGGLLGAPGALSFTSEVTFPGLEFRAGTFDQGPRAVPVVADIDGDGRAEVLFDAPGNAAVAAALGVLRTSQPGDVAIDAGPIPSRLRPGQTATFAVAAHPVDGDSELSYRWFKNGVALSEGGGGGRISGASRATLTIEGLGVSDSGSYSVRVSTACFTREAFAYLDCTAQCSDADFNQDGRLDPDDLSDYIREYFSGCP